MTKRVILLLSILSFVLVPGLPQAQMKSPDFNGDDKVDFDDFFLFADAFGTKNGDPKFDSKFDLSGNGIVDFDDFFIFAAAFGKVIPRIEIASINPSSGQPGQNVVLNGKFTMPGPYVVWFDTLRIPALSQDEQTVSMIVPLGITGNVQVALQDTLGQKSKGIAYV